MFGEAPRPRRPLTAPAEQDHLDNNPGSADNPPQPQLEAEFISGPDYIYAIYQMKNDEALRNHQFESIDHLLKYGLTVDHQNYNLTYTGHFEAVGDANVTLNSIYEKFNEDRPKDFTGHSLSMSDVIVLEQNGALTTHYVDSFGFKEVPEFIKLITPLRSIEDTVEQNDNHFDGLINNISVVNFDKTNETADSKEDKKSKKESVKQRLKKSVEKSEIKKHCLTKLQKWRD